MTNYFERIIDVNTGEETIRPYTQQEIAEVEAAEAKIKKDNSEREATQAAKDAARQVVLDKLGLSSEEIAALLG